MANLWGREKSKSSVRVHYHDLTLTYGNFKQVGRGATRVKLWKQILNTVTVSGRGKKRKRQEAQEKDERGRR